MAKMLLPCLQKKKHGAYTIRNSMEFYPSQRLNTISITTWQIVINVNN